MTEDSVQETSDLSAHRSDQALPDETTLMFVRPDTSGPSGVSEGTGTFMLFLRMVVVLALVVACIYVIGRLLRRAVNPALPPDPYIKKAASVTLSPGKTVHVITVGSQAFVVGAADNGVTLIGELTDRELIDAMNLHGGNEPSGKPRDFASLLASFWPGNMNRGSANQGSAERRGGASPERADLSVSAEETTEYLRRQRERLREGADRNKQGEQSVPGEQP
ncbi:MAG: flagellar biosynthetic protein FliO [Spirochaetaceae bacterium]|nr:flagellar biosynthetic protein FliO [Spirochaetaceae bacterium]